MPSAFVTVRKPDVAPLGTLVVILVAEATVNVAAVPLNLTLLAPVKLVPVRVTLVPTVPVLGVKLVMIGGSATLVTLTVIVADALRAPSLTATVRLYIGKVSKSSTAVFTVSAPVAAFTAKAPPVLPAVMA